MTTDQLVKYYQDLLIIQYRSKAKARAHIDAVVRPVLIDQILLSIQDAFSIDAAVGVQLDVVGKYAGITRQQRTFTGPITLTDDQFRVLIKIQILLNFSDGSYANIQQILFISFAGSIRLFDHKQMYMSVFFDSSLGSMQLAEVFVRGGFIPRPMGVRLSALIYSPDINTKPFFGMRTATTEALGAVGFNTVTDYHQDWPWLSASQAIV